MRTLRGRIAIPVVPKPYVTVPPLKKIEFRPPRYFYTYFPIYTKVTTF